MEPETERQDSDLFPAGDHPLLIPVKGSRQRGLGKRRRLMVIVIAAIGLISFGSPIIRTDSEVLGRTQWSPLQIGLELYKGNLPICYLNEPADFKNPHAHIVDLGISAAMGSGIELVLLIAIVLAALFWPNAGFVGVAAFFGLDLILVSGKYNWDEFDDYICAGTIVHSTAFEMILLGVFALLLWIAATKALDY